MVTRDARGWDHLGIPIKFADEPGRARLRLPAHGEHSSEVLRGLGYAEDEIAKLKQGGVIRDATPEDLAAHAGE
jgi:formyl-CoA transferase